MSNIQTLIKLASSLSKFAEDNEKISLPAFSIKLARAQQQFPEDYTIGMMNTVVSRMANSDKLLISRAEVNDLYEKFYSRNNKFASIFAEELGKKAEETNSKPVKTAEQIPVDIMKSAIDELIDPVLANSLNQAFGGTETHKEYNEKTAKLVSSTCDRKFKTLGFDVKSEVYCGKNGILVCAVAFETPKGTTSVLVPVEVSNNQVFSPTMFIANAGVEELNKSTIVNYITSRAGEKLGIHPQEVLTAAATSENVISDVDLALIKLNSSKETSPKYAAPSITGVKVEEENPNLVLNLPKIEDPKFEAIAKTFDSEMGSAYFRFGTQTIKLAHSLIEKQLKSCGLNNYTIAVSSSDDNSITYAVALNGGTIAFKVPVKIEKNAAIPPAFILCNGALKSFDKKSLNSILRENGFDKSAASFASPLYGIKGSELVNIVKNAIAEENYIKAEDALNVLAQSDDDKAYQTALAVFSQGLNQKNATTEPECNCSMIVKSAHSQYELCGHTGLPLHKVFQDKFGQCQPLYRKSIQESSEGSAHAHPSAKFFF